VSIVAHDLQVRQATISHPLEASELGFDSVAEVKMMSQLRQLQGQQAPIKLMMERRAVKQVCKKVLTREV